MTNSLLKFIRLLQIYIHTKIHMITFNKETIKCLFDFIDGLIKKRLIRTFICHYYFHFKPIIRI